MRFAAANGGRTIEMTAGGRFLNATNPFLQRIAPQFNKSLWERASGYFANGSSGNTNVFLKPNFNPSGSWATIERPALERWGQAITEHAVIP